MPADAVLNFDPLTDPVNFFATHTAFNAWFGTITVTIGAANLPLATTLAVGAVKKASVATYAATNLTLTYLGITTAVDGDGVERQYVAADITTMDDLKTKFDALSASHRALLDALVASGALELT